jgi:hypothetical protein
LTPKTGCYSPLDPCSRQYEEIVIASGIISAVGLLAKHRVSNNVGSVKHIQGAPIPGLVRARHFALVEAVALAFAFALPTKARS